MSWCIDIQDGGAYGGKKYLLKSIEDGELCWWENVSVWQYPKVKTDEFVHWKWADDKWLLWDRWKRVFQKRDSFGLVSMMPQFQDNGVTLRLRERWTDIEHTKTFPNYKRLTQKEMLLFYDEIEERRNSKKQTE